MIQEPTNTCTSYLQAVSRHCVPGPLRWKRNYKELFHFCNQKPSAIYNCLNIYTLKVARNIGRHVSCDMPTRNPMTYPKHCTAPRVIPKINVGRSNILYFNFYHVTSFLHFKLHTDYMYAGMHRVERLFKFRTGIAVQNSLSLYDSQQDQGQD